MKNKNDYFKRPELVREIVDERQVVYSQRETLAEKIESLTKDQSLVIDYKIIPENYRNGAHFLKRGPQINLKRYRTLEEAINDSIPMWKLREQRFKQINKNKNYCGYGWWGIRKSREFKKVHLVDCIKGAKLFVFSELSRKNEDKTKVRRYDGHSKARKKGGKYLIEVPSMTKQMKYLVNLEYIPITRKRNKYSIIFDLSTRHGCEAYVANTFSYRYATSEVGFCPHIIAAYHKFAKEEWDNGNKTPMQMNPFAIPTKQTVDFYNKLERQVMIKEYYYDKNRKMRSKRRPLNKAEKEILLWKYVAAHGPKKTFYATEKLTKYNNWAA